ncbi:dynamin family protein [Blastococcus tunisiensis]|uniref:Dynamin family protein n=1 Tax=Blastococcus tunisiensis TaxID=1798228 RepID=A0A1I2FH25_9ACTN|nr:dynamin family protein [Blastococcus sp. DSM 46838]SFF04565.1 Dynamin family protein [Blastococcus sp. DSM 46838]
MGVPSVSLIDRAIRLAGECERPDLVRRLALVQQRTRRPSVRVLVVGEPKKGKSSLVNGLLGAPVCAVADDVATVVPTVVRQGPEPRAFLVHPATRGADGGDPATEEPGDRVEVPVGSLVARMAELRNAPAGRPVLRAEVELPRRLLDGGLEIVDTPGLGGVGAVRSLAALDLVPSADAVVVVSDATQEFTAPEMAFLEQAAALCPNVVCVLTKTDVTSGWRTVLDLDQAHLRARGIDAPVLPVSSSLALLAVRHRDRELHEESGLGPLTTYLRTEVVQQAETLAQRSLVHDLTGVTEHLSMAVRSELAILEDPTGKDALVQELETARDAVDELRRRSSRWQQVLGDGVTDLMADIDYDLRDRSRVVTREAEEAIDACDPGPMWPQLAEWLDQRVGVAVADSFVWAEQRSEFLAAQVTEQFARDGGATLPELSIGDAAEVLGGVVDVPGVDDGYLKLRERFLIGVRGSYTGVLMTGLVTSLAGMALINPISLAAGVLLGRKAYNDDKAQRLQRRQAEAKAAVRRHLDEVVFQVGKHLKDRLRLVQRTLRDLITDTVDQMSETLADSLRAAQRSAKDATAERTARVRVLRQRLEQLDGLAAEAHRLLPPPAPVPAEPPSGPALRAASGQQVTSR